MLFTMLMCMVSTTSFAHDIEVKNADGVTIYYKWIKNQTELSVCYQGERFDSFENEYFGNIVIPESVQYDGKTYNVTSIYEGAFFGCSGLTSIVISNSIEIINGIAFADCTELTSITIPNSVTSIGINILYGCI